MNIERVIAALLWTGVISSAVVVLFAGAWFLTLHGAEKPQYARFMSEPSDLLSPRETLREAEHFDSLAVMMTGLLILIATPILRVAFAVFAFGVQKDWVYVGMASFVLLVLLYGIAQ